jgi:hypothetical protein
MLSLFFIVLRLGGSCVFNLFDIMVGFGGFGVWWSSPKTHSTDPTLSTF